MATYTQNYALHQWEDTDDFLRTDFNADFLKLDTAIKGEKTALQESIATNAYNIYNLILQNYYEGKVTSYKKALYFDGFMEETTSTLSDSLVQRNNTIMLYAQGEASQEWLDCDYTCSSATSLSTPTVTATATGLVTGFTFFVATSSGGLYNTARCTYNGVFLESGNVYYSNVSNGELTYTLSTPLTVVPGDTVQFGLGVNSTNGLTYYCSSTTELAGRMHITPIEDTTGTITQSCDLGCAWDSAHLWVRRSGGSLVPTLNDVDMTLSESTETQTLDGIDCTEEHWVGGIGSDTIYLIFTLLVGDDPSVTVYDYGIIFL